MTTETKQAIAADMMQLKDADFILKKYDISKPTFYRLRTKDDEFKKILSEMRTANYEATITNAYAMAETAIGTIINIMENDKSSTRERLDAATRIINLSKEHFAEVEVITRLEELKKIVQEKDGY